MNKRIKLNAEQLAKYTESEEFIKKNLAEFINGLPHSLKEEESKFQKNLANQNLSRKMKLIKIYNIADKITGHAIDFVPCKKGCSSCCKMNVMITPIEAELIQKATGIKANNITNQVVYDIDEFTNVPCPFLENEECSIYAFRPFACRKHLHFDRNNFLCQPENYSDKQITTMHGSYENSYIELTSINKNGAFADIRDFFNSSLTTVQTKV